MKLALLPYRPSYKKYRGVALLLDEGNREASLRRAPNHEVAFHSIALHHHLAGVPKRLDGLVLIIIRGAHAGNEHSLRIPSEKVLKQSRDDAIPERNMRLLLRERCNYLAQGEQPFVDLDPFFDLLALGPGLFQTLRSGQIDKVEFRREELIGLLILILFPFDHRLLRQPEGENGMGARRLLVPALRINVRKYI
eukprot:CAMPEP_0114519912 /NCGR_PEP_ID=MMETSP0109-20121206/19277_1 /TAXON_ID=29199 /ORGANISM="Chlorarachnion reptans, Strain CCCM449" /LENGTH=193 /DNA_ID=CAMNT_0001700725 /DNA_START=998 /DNA_END=1579 /DNA_ORIENTATION=+